MKKAKLLKMVLPEYSKGEEVFNMTSHIVGGGIGVIALVLGIIFSSLHKNIYGIIGSIVFGVSMILLYTCSSIYHGLNPKLLSKKVFRIIDHCSIFLLISGTYTPICLSALREFDAKLSYTLLTIVWASAIFGIILNSIDLEKAKTISGICYLVMGWSIVGAYKALPFMIERGGISLLVLGGISYSVGAVFYYFLKGRKYMHSVFHLFVVLGSVLHMLYVLFFVI